MVTCPLPSSQRLLHLRLAMNLLEWTNISKPLGWVVNSNQCFRQLRKNTRTGSSFMDSVHFNLGDLYRELLMLRYLTPQLGFLLHSEHLHAKHHPCKRLASVSMIFLWVSLRAAITSYRCLCTVVSITNVRLFFTVKRPLSRIFYSVNNFRIAFFALNLSLTAEEYCFICYRAKHFQ